MANIRKIQTINGVSYQVRWTSTEHTSGRSYKTFGTLKAARAFIENLGSFKAKPSHKKFGIFDAVDRWVEICEKTGRDGRECVERETLKEYERRARVMKEYPWIKQLDELKASDIVQFRNWLLEHKSRDLARRTLSSFHSVLIEMKHQGYLSDDPAAGVTIKTSGRHKDSEGEVIVPTEQEIKDILAAADVMGLKSAHLEKQWARYRPMIYLAAFSGMRPSEYRGLPWSNLSDGTVNVRQRADKTGQIGPVKSKAGRRTIYLPKRITDIAFEWKSSCPESDLDLVFPTKTGRPLALNNFATDAWLPLMREACCIDYHNVGGKKVERVRYTPYALRHFYASKLIELGRDFKSIQTALGHSSIEITFDVYGHLIRDKESKHRENAESLLTSIL